MAARRATKRYQTGEDFIRDYEESLSELMVSIDSDCYRGSDVSDTLKLDLSVPDVGRIGPITAQVVLRGEDGVVALRIPEMPAEVLSAYTELKQQLQSDLDNKLQPLLDAGLVVRMEDHEAQISELTNQIEELTRDHSLELESLHAEIAELKIALEHAQEVGIAPTAQRVTRRGFQVPDVTGLKPSFSGTISGGFTQFLMLLQSRQLSGVLIVTEGQRTRYGFCKDGGLVGWSSNPVSEEECLGALLCANKQISESQLAESLKLMEELSIRQGDALVHLGILTPIQIPQVLSKQVEYILQRVLQQSSASFQFYELLLNEAFTPNPLLVASTLFAKAWQSAQSKSTAEIGRELASMLNSPLQLSPLLREVSRLIPWTAGQRSLLTSISQEKRNLRTYFAMQIQDMSRTEVAAFIWVCIQLRLLTTDEVTETSNIINRVSSGECFEILGLHWVCTLAQVQAAHKRALAEAAGIENEGDKSNVLGAISECYQRLSNDNNRRAYRNQLIGESVIHSAAAKLASAGKKAFSDGDKTKAAECFTKALELMPSHQPYIKALAKLAS